MDEFRAHPSADNTSNSLGQMNRTLSFYWTIGELGIKADRRSSNYFFRPVSEARTGADSGTKRYQLSMAERHSETQLLEQDLPVPGISPHCPNGMAEGMLLECTVPAWLLQCHGTFSDTVEICQLQWMHNKIIQCIEIAWKINARIAAFFILGFPHLWECLFALEIDK